MRKIPLKWIIYFFGISFVLTGYFSSLLNENSDIYTYYHILMAFNNNCAFFYYLNIISALLNTVALLPVYFYLKRKSVGKEYLWRTLFILTIAFNVAGHSFELNFIKSIFLDNVSAAVYLILVTIILFSPMIVAFFRYAFFRHKLIK